MPNRTSILVLATAALLGGLAAGAAGPAEAKSLIVTATSSVIGPTATVDVTVNRQFRAIASCTFVLVIGSTASCGDPSSPTKGSTTYQFPLLGGLPTGTFTVTVTVRTTDGGVARASTTFDLVLAPCYVTNLTTSSRYDGSGPNLQAAINAATSGDTLRIQGHCIGNFTVVAKELTVVGIPEDDYPTATLDANQSGRVVLVECSCGNPVTTDLTLTNVLITHGVAEDLGFGTLNDLGGGIYNNHGFLTLNGSTRVSDNRGAYGGGIASFGDVTLKDSVVVTGNAATLEGGGVYNLGGSIALRGQASVTGNTAGGSGGGVFSSGQLSACNWTGTISPNTPEDPPTPTAISC